MIGKYADTIKLRKELTPFIDKYGHISCSITKFNILLERSTYDVAEIVRCRDCRFHEDEQIGMVYCPAVVGGWVEDNWFCKGGEQEDEYVHRCGRTA